MSRSLQLSLKHAQGRDIGLTKGSTPLPQTPAPLCIRSSAWMNVQGDMLHYSEDHDPSILGLWMSMARWMSEWHCMWVHVLAEPVRGPQLPSICFADCYLWRVAPQVPARVPICLRNLEYPPNHDSCEGHHWESSLLPTRYHQVTPLMRILEGVCL